MFKDEMKAVCHVAEGKVKLLRENRMGYIISSFMAGLFIALGSIVMGIVGGYMTAGGSPATRLVCGLIFSVGLCFVTMAGAELFTGNNFVMAVAGMYRCVSWSDTFTLWCVCYLGNLAGSVTAALIFTMTGIPGGGEVEAFFANTAAAKLSSTAPNLFAKAILCNICVCIAIWCGVKLKTETGKIIMNFCCVTTFVTCGFEHSVANMTFLTIGLLNANGLELALSGFFYNLVIVTLGNMVGGVLFVALPYYLISQNKSIAVPYGEPAKRGDTYDRSDLRV